MKTTDHVDRFVIGRESNILRVDFDRESDSPAPRFPRCGRPPALAIGWSPAQHAAS
jgi:hypothetical protein